MAILEQQRVISDSGFKKRIDEAGMEMVLDNLQVSQYQYPVKSTIREIVSNSVDSISEKEIAQLILTGKAKEEDYYIRREDPLYKDSNFDPSYYDLSWLDTGSKKVEILYEEGNNTTRDRIRIKDNGVGLGGKRLEGYFKLSWSSKRNSKKPLGKFGIGAKAPLSTGVDSYRMISTYNGKRFTFDIFSHKVDSATPKFDLKNNSMKQNPHIVMYEGQEDETVVYYEETKEKNGVEIIIETKKNHRQQYIDAIKSQLLYFKNVDFYIVKESGYKETVNFRANIIYQDEDIILSDNNQFSKPHLVIGKDDAQVAYGYIDFLELELEDKTGNIGIKVESEQVAINPSRESVIWNEKTRKTVVDKFQKVVGVATEMVTEQLRENNFISWVQKATNVLAYTSNSNDVLSRLSRIVDKSGIEPVFIQDDRIKYNSNPKKTFPGYDVRRVTVSKNGAGKVIIRREEVYSVGDINFNNMYITEKPASQITD